MKTGLLGHPTGKGAMTGEEQEGKQRDVDNVLLRIENRKTYNYSSGTNY